MIVKKYFNYYPLEISQIISADGEVVYDRNNRKKSYCFIDLNTNEKMKQKGDEICQAM